MRLRLPVFLPFTLFAVSAALAQAPAGHPEQPGTAPAEPSKPNSDRVYQQLRHITVGSEAVVAENLALKRDAGTFAFKSGNFFFLTPVQGKVTGAVFIGEGTFSLVPPLEMEKRSLALLTKEPAMNEGFSEAVFRFTDGTYEELKRLGRAPTGPIASGASGILEENQTTLRRNLQYNLHIRVLQDVLSTEPGGFFAAFIKGNKYSKKELYIIDPHGVPGIAPRNLPDLRLAPEEVGFLTYEDQFGKFGVWAAFHFSGEYSTGKATGSQENGIIHVEHQKLDTTIDRSGRLTGTATTTFVALANSLRVVELNLFPTLQVNSVTAADEQQLPFIQEDKKEDPQFAVILPKALKAGERYTITTSYSGPDAVKNEGGGNYYPVTREAWYPNTDFGDYATYELTFRIPTGLKMVATGVKTREVDEGDQNISEWKSQIPLAVAGFNFGRFKKEEAKLPEQNYDVESYANLETPDILKGIQLAMNDVEWQTKGRLIGANTLGTLNTTTMMKKALGEAQLAIPLYTEYFGPAPYTRLAMTQQTAFAFGQSWPTLVYLPITSFFDSTTRHQFGMDDPHGFFKVVGPHEVAHQWWGHAVGFHSYRDQWMSEGFAEFSASLFLQAVYKDGNEFNKFWDDERDLLTRKNKEGFRAIDVGPVIMGYRLVSTKAGFDVYRKLVYPKGGYILHMIRMMMWDMQNGDQRFKDMMQEFVKTYMNRPATTEDFKVIVEKHMIPSMDIAGDGKMDWFFNEYVYGTALPNYKFEYSFSNAPEGTVMMSFKIAQSNVDDSFRMPVPIYLELANRRLFRIGMVPMAGNRTFEKQIALRGLKEKPRRAMLNYFDDILCTQRD